MSHASSFLKKLLFCWRPENFKEHNDEVIVEQAPQPLKIEVCDVAEARPIMKTTDGNIEAQSPASSCGTCFFDPDEQGISVPER